MFLDGKKNGKGKEYICEYEERGYDDKDWYTNLIYDGNYKNDLKNGKGKAYNHGKLIFDGEYLNGYSIYYNNVIEEGMLDGKVKKY